ncbi:hypothetical protein BDZ85DRAFT_206782 [Elsinoe ampelina]|uniref:VWFA domain-containing protein n=1 Tax=Elsinoe ampelina TaxID=302913 RepID=A0A6A6FZV0_9PEZI|nr:hypothetical protein BDZ85DRAFT_206782 [Elsinoe ampelina]
MSRRSPSPPLKSGPSYSSDPHATTQVSRSAPLYPSDPPPYSAHAASTSIPSATPFPASSTTSTARPAASQDDPYAFLSTFDTLFLIDDSSSMRGSRWTTARSAVATIAPICTAHDLDGIDIHFLNAPAQPYHSNVTSASTVNEIFSSVEPFGGTPTGQCLDKILRDYFMLGRSRPDIKPLNIIVITDGVPTDDVESALVAAAKKLDKLDAPAWQVGVQFFQVGDDESAAESLKGLDDGLSELAGKPVRDMIDTVPLDKKTRGSGGRGASEELTADGILKVVLGAVNRRLDRREQGTHA